MRPALPDGIEVLDVEMFGVADLSCSYLLHGPEPALIETGPATVLEPVLAHLRKRAIEPRHIIVSHIHLDHSGAAGHLSEIFPGATIWVHSVGAPHLIDPSKLINSARRLFGDALDTMYGESIPVPEERVRVIDDGDVIPLGGDRRLEVLYTPGHANHEVTIYDPEGKCAFIGDSAGLCLGDDGKWQSPAIPPPEFDLEKSLDSLNKIKALNADAICFTHFGPAAEPSLDRASQDLRAWDAKLGPMVERGAEEAEMIEAIEHIWTPPTGSTSLAQGAGNMANPAFNLAGYTRYKRKRIEAENSAPPSL